MAMLSQSIAADSPALSKADTKFVEQEVANSMNAMRLDELAAKKSPNPEIQAFAKEVATEQKQANEEINTFASSRNVTIKEVKNDDYTRVYTNLDKANTQAFDKDYLDAVIRQSERGVKDFENLSANKDTDSDLKAWADKMLLTMQSRVAKAKDLRSASTKKADTSSRRTEATQPDNTARNERDSDSQTLTPLDQGNNKADIDTTAEIRREVRKLDDMSINAQNVKIITNEGHVTLRGPVNSAEEKQLIGEVAARIATTEHTDNQLEVKNDETSN